MKRVVRDLVHLEWNCHPIPVLGECGCQPPEQHFLSPIQIFLRHQRVDRSGQRASPGLAFDHDVGQQGIGVPDMRNGHLDGQGSRRNTNRRDGGQWYGLGWGARGRVHNDDARYRRIS